MKKWILLGLALAMMMSISGCGDGSDSPSQGTVTANMTDAKPTLPDGNVESVSITFNEVSVHKSGGGWVTLPTAQQPYTLDLYQFNDGRKTQIVPPVKIDSGKYTQVRIGVVSGTMTISGHEYPLEIPSSNLRTDKNFEFDVPKDGAVDLTVDFDLSQSIVATGAGTYQLKPVLHLNETSKAATIQGTIGFGTSTQATVIVTWDKNASGAIDDGDEEYTRITVASSEAAPFNIFWLVPNEDYIVQVIVEGKTSTLSVAASNLSPGAVYALNGGNTITP